MDRGVAMVLGGLALCGCMESDPTAPRLLERRAVARPALLAGGGAAGVVLLHTEGRLHLYRQDPAAPDALVELGAVPAGVPSALGLSPTRAALIAGRDVLVIDHTAAPPTALAVTTSALPLASCLAPGAVADGRWLLASNGGSLELLDVEAPASRWAYAARTGCITQLLAVERAFMAFTTGGWVVVRPERAAAGQAFLETSSAILGTVRAAFADGPKAMLAGEAGAGASWVARLDLLGQVVRVVARLDLDLPFGAFAWDGLGTSVLQGLEAPPGGSRRYGDGWVVREQGTGLRASPVALPGWAGTGCAGGVGGQLVCDEVPREHLAAVAGRLYALEGPPSAFGWYELR